MNLHRIASAATVTLALLATATPAWTAEGPDWAGGNSGIASYLAREFARLQQASEDGALPDPRRDGSWSHDSRILLVPSARDPYSWDHDSRMLAQPPARNGYSWDHDSRASALPAPRGSSSPDRPSGTGR